MFGASKCTERTGVIVTSGTLKHRWQFMCTERADVIIRVLFVPLSNVDNLCVQKELTWLSCVVSWKCDCHVWCLEIHRKSWRNCHVWCLEATLTICVYRKSWRDYRVLLVPWSNVDKLCVQKELTWLSCLLPWSNVDSLFVQKELTWFSCFAGALKQRWQFLCKERADVICCKANSRLLSQWWGTMRYRPRKKKKKKDSRKKESFFKISSNYFVSVSFESAPM